MAVPSHVPSTDGALNNLERDGNRGPVLVRNEGRVRAREQSQPELGVRRALDDAVHDFAG